MKLFYKDVPEHEYGTYPRRFARYRWFRPLLAGVIALVIFLILSNLTAGTAAAMSGNTEDFLTALSGGYDSFDSYSVLGILAELGSIAMIIPSLMIAAKIVRDRPFSSYGSAMGGFRIDLCLKSLIPSLAALLPSIFYALFVDGRVGANRFSIVSFLLLLIIGPLQCIAEEYMFRGYIMQTVGSWTKVPLAGLLAQVLVFSLLHPYNFWGVLSVAVSGLTLGFLALYTKGLEAGSAFHIVNNMTGFILSGIGFGVIRTEVTMCDALFSVLSCVIVVVLTVILQEKSHIYDKQKKDDAAEFNFKYPA